MVDTRKNPGRWGREKEKGRRGSGSPKSFLVKRDSLLQLLKAAQPLLGQQPVAGRGGMDAVGAPDAGAAAGGGLVEEAVALGIGGHGGGLHHGNVALELHVALGLLVEAGDAMAHQLGGFYNLPHGVCNAVLLPHVQVFNSKVAAARLRDCAAAMGVNVTGKNDAEGAEACINAIRELAKKVDIPAGLRDLNVKEEDFAVLATNALKDACGFTNPIQATHEEIVAIYRAAM